MSLRMDALVLKASHRLPQFPIAVAKEPRMPQIGEWPQKSSKNKKGWGLRRLQKSSPKASAVTLSPLRHRRLAKPRLSPLPRPARTIQPAFNVPLTSFLISHFSFAPLAKIICAHPCPPRSLPFPFPFPFPSPPFAYSAPHRPSPSPASRPARSLAPNIPRAQPVIDDPAHRRLDRVRRGVFAKRIAQHHRRGKNLRDRVGDALARDVRRSPPLGSNNPKRPVAVSLSPRLALGSIPSEPRDQSHLIAQNVAEQILRQHHIEPPRILDQLHRRVVT